MKKIVGAILFLLVSSVCLANSAPVVGNVSVSQRTDGSGMVDISYTLSDADNNRCTITVLASSDGGSTWTITPSPSALSGDLTNVSPGSRHITWNSKLDQPGIFGSNYRIKIIADDGVVDGPTGMVWVYINDPGVGFGTEGFNGYMSKYETTNSQYCQYLNAAKAANQITVYNNIVYATSDTSHTQPYFINSQITYSGSTFSVCSRDGYSMTNHPVAYISWYGAMAFCNYYGYRLPTEWEWQAVADYDGSYAYGCGTTISQSMANYQFANPLGLMDRPWTTPVGYYPAYGYGMCDMAGNVWELTSSLWYPGGSYLIFRGGSWYTSQSCSVSEWYFIPQDGMYFDIGFRACR